MSSSGAPSPPCSAPGTMPAPSPIGGCTTSPTTGARRSPCRPWCSAIAASGARPASSSPAIPPPARRSFTASSWSTRKARTWSPGLRTPQPLTEAARKAAGDRRPSLEALMPDVFAELTGKRCAKLEAHFRDIQDIEFTVEEGKLWMLQTRSGKRSMQAALKIAVDMAAEGADQPRGGRRRHRSGAARPALASDARSGHRRRPSSPRALPASPGAASGELVFDADEAVHLKAQGHTVILARVETSPEDVQGMHAAAGILTTRGGMTSHAAVVARGMGRPCVSGAASVQIDLERGDAASRRRAAAQGRHRHHRRLERPDHQGPRADARARPLRRTSPR